MMAGASPFPWKVNDWKSPKKSDANELLNNGLIRTWELEVVGYKNHFFINFMLF